MADVAIGPICTSSRQTCTSKSISYTSQVLGLGTSLPARRARVVALSQFPLLQPFPATAAPAICTSDAKSPLKPNPGAAGMSSCLRGKGRRSLSKSVRRLSRGLSRLRSIAGQKGLTLRLPSKRLNVKFAQSALSISRSLSRAQAHQQQQRQRSFRVLGLGTSLSRKKQRPRQRGGRRHGLALGKPSSSSGVHIQRKTRAVRVPGTPRSSVSFSSARSLSSAPLTPWRKWVVFRQEDDPEETENNIEIGLGAVKASIPLAPPLSKPIVVTRSPSFPRSPSSAFSLSLALSCAFPMSLKLPGSPSILLPVALSFSLTLSLLPFLVGSGTGAAAQTAIEISVGQATAELPFSFLIPAHLPLVLSSLGLAHHAVAA